jgi:allantoin racemase
MRIRVIAPIISDVFNEEILKEASQFRGPDMDIDVVNLSKGPASIESHYDEILAAYHVVELVVQAEKQGIDGVFVDCFGDPGVDASRELVRIPVVGGFQPAVLTASIIAGKWSVVTVLQSVVPMINDLARKLGVEKNMVSVRDINTPVLELTDKGLMERRLRESIEKAVHQDGAEAIVLGCTGMLGLADRLEKDMAKRGVPVPVIDPTASAIGFLEMLIRCNVTQSFLTYPRPSDKERKL